MNYKLIKEAWDKFVEQVESEKEQEEKADIAAQDLQKHHGQRPKGVEVSKKMPIVNGINFILPIKGNRKISAGFRQKRGGSKEKPILHRAIDQNVPIGTECVAIADGEVVYAISQEEYDNNCKQFLDIMKKDVFGVDRSKLRQALKIINRTNNYARNRSRPVRFNAKSLKKKMRSDEWRKQALQKLNSVKSDWNGIREFQKWLSGEELTGSPRQICIRSLATGRFCNFCAMLMRYLLKKGRVNRRMMAGKYINILTDPDQNGQRWQISYMHMDSYNFNVGDKVKAGDVIGTSGASGIADSSPHLHLAIRKGKGGPKRDPAKLIPGLGNRENPQKLINSN